MTHLRLVPPAPSKMPDVDCLAFTRIGEDIFICFKGEWDLALPGRPGYDAFLGWLRNIDKFVNAAGPIPWPLPKVPA